MGGWNVMSCWNDERIDTKTRELVIRGECMWNFVDGRGVVMGLALVLESWASENSGNDILRGDGTNICEEASYSSSASGTYMR